MTRGIKKPTTEELQASIRQSFERWDRLHRRGGADPLYADGSNMNLVRNHIIYYKKQLLDLCKEQKIAKCPREAKRKPPRIFSDNYCAPRSKAGPCRRRLSASARMRIMAAQKKRWAEVKKAAGRKS